MHDDGSANNMNMNDNPLFIEHGRLVSAGGLNQQPQVPAQFLNPHPAYVEPAQLSTSQPNMAFLQPKMNPAPVSNTVAPWSNLNIAKDADRSLDADVPDTEEKQPLCIE
jgi:hypothetical protein